MSPYKFYKIYWSVKLHFTSQFDLFKYAHPPFATLEDFGARRDYFEFESKARRMIDDQYTLEFCVFNFTNNHNWLYESFEIAKECYIDKKKFFGRFKDNIKSDNAKVQHVKNEKDITFDTLVKTTAGGNKAPLLQMYLHKVVSLEYICVVDGHLDFVDNWADEYVNDPLVSSELFKIKKYAPFVRKFGKL